MSNSFYNHGSTPATGSVGSSATIRAEFDAIGAGFDKFPVLSGFENKALVVNAGGTAVTLTVGSLALAGNLTTAGAYASTFTMTGATTVTFPTTGTLATLTGTESLTNKTINLTNNILTGTIAQFNTACSDADFATLAGAETLTNKTITSPILSGTSTGTYTIGGTPTGSLVSVLATGSTTARTLATRFADWTNVLDYGAVCDGVTDDSTAFTNAFAASKNGVIAPPGASFYMVKNVTIPTGKTLFAHGAYFKDLAGASYIFKLTGYSTKLIGAYISRASNCSVGAVVIDSGNKCTVEDVHIIDATSGIVLQATGTPTNTAQTSLRNIRVDSFTGVGIDVKKDVSNTIGVDIWCDANSVSGGGALIPRAGSTGFRQTGTGSVTAYGGHNWSCCVAINCETGFRFDASQLTKLNNCASDSCSGRGISIANASDYIDISDHFIGVCGRGIEIANTSTRCSVVGFRTHDTGVIPSWGGTTFFSSASPAYSAPFYDVAVLDTATLFVNGSSWYAGSGRAITVDSGAKLHMNGDDAFHCQSIGTVAAGATQYLGINGESGTEQPTVWRAPCAGTIVKLFVAPTAAPGAAQTFTYTFRKNYADSALVATVSGAASFDATAYGEIEVAAGDSICTKLVTSGGAAVTHHNVSFIFLKSWG